MVSTKNQLRAAMNRFEMEVVNPIISEINFSFMKQVIYHISLISGSILVNLNPTIASMIGTLAIVFMGISSNWLTACETFKMFTRDRRSLLRSLMEINIFIDLCSEDDETGLKEVETLLRTLLDVTSK